MQEQKHTQSPTRPLVFTIQETMVALGISRSTVNRWAADGMLKKVVIGPNSARITTDSIYSLLNPA